MQNLVSTAQPASSPSSSMLGGELVGRMLPMMLLMLPPEELQAQLQELALHSQR